MIRNSSCVVAKVVHILPFLIKTLDSISCTFFFTAVGISFPATVACVRTSICRRDLRLPWCQQPSAASPQYKGRRTSDSSSSSQSSQSIGMHAPNNLPDQLPDLRRAFASSSPPPLTGKILAGLPRACLLLKSHSSILVGDFPTPNIKKPLPVIRRGLAAGTKVSSKQLPFPFTGNVLNLEVFWALRCGFRSFSGTEIKLPNKATFSGLGELTIVNLNDDNEFLLYGSSDEEDGSL
ncbi:unnamed protein product [Lactuca saligna]|uniref:Uncharacterized protein n=1 Tax=Lactuca saligna TaxID=75948 RepID=A0AA35YGD0_LACSI|nr:unnamed protein product [Lactuca saligna]